jgi:hypothetical protein
MLWQWGWVWDWGSREFSGVRSPGRKKMGRVGEQERSRIRGLRTMCGMCMGSVFASDRSAWCDVPHREGCLDPGGTASRPSSRF